MHGTRDAAQVLAKAVVAFAPQAPSIDIGVCPPTVLLPVVTEIVRGSSVRLGAQTCSEYDSGAYTGEVSAPMLREIGCELVLVGHSERRQLFAESSVVIAAKMARAHAHGLIPVLCVGETLAERQAGTTEAVIAAQLAPVYTLDNAVKLLSASVIAYEPVWAIGTGETASPAQAQAVHAFLRDTLSRVAPALAQTVRVLYGGSVKPSNAEELFAMPDIDGGLIGGASLKAEEFCSICAAAQRQAH
jgi:triosephosphate isomerase (TIM)